MVFNSLTFAIFFIIVFALHSLPISWRARKANLLIASYVFYAAWNPPFVVLIWISTIADWRLARRIHAAVTQRRRKQLLAASLSINLGLLGVFKYGDFLLDNFSELMALIGVTYSPPALDIVLPVGISFYTFQTLSYTFDVYRRKLTPWPSFLDFALFVTFFPQLVAGPIVRASAFLVQLVEAQKATRDQVGWGLALLTMGLFQKVVFADAISAPVADVVFDAPSKAGMIDAWIGTLAFANQIFYDFAGYSACAIGAALMLGFRLPENFQFPYAAVGFSDFWRRWHISLSSWLRDYLYVSLGGNRGRGLFTLRNLLLAMLLGGLWHGAAWRFVIWGGLHGAYLVVERLIRSRRHGTSIDSLLSQLILSLVTFFFVCIAWVFFRAGSSSDAFSIIRSMMGAQVDQLSLGRAGTLNVAALTIATLGSHWWLRNRSLETLWTSCAWWVRAALLATMIYCIAIAPGGDRVFIYFQF